jgi:hypothetical protein
MSGTQPPPVSEADLRQVQANLYRVQARWEPWKALAAMAATCALLVGTILGLANYLARSPQTIVVHFDQPIPLGRTQ